MKTILVATDLSAAADQAIAYGAHLAKAMQARLVLFSAYEEIPVPITELTTVRTLDDLKAVTLQLLSEKAEQIRKEYELQVETYYKRGLAPAAIQEAAQDYHALLIITARKETGKTYRKLFGSTVTALARITTTPMIVVPENTPFAEPKTIAVALDETDDPDQPMHFPNILHQLTEHFQSKLYLVRVTANSPEATYEMKHRPIRLNPRVRELNSQVEYSLGENIPQVLHTYTKERQAQLLAIFPHKHSLVERWFSGSTTRAMIFKTDVPLLVLPETA